jgi:hypothetical protein
MIFLGLKRVAPFEVVEEKDAPDGDIPYLVMHVSGFVFVLIGEACVCFGICANRGDGLHILSWGSIFHDLLKSVHLTSRGL